MKIHSFDPKVISLFNDARAMLGELPDGTYASLQLTETGGLAPSMGADAGVSAVSSSGLEASHVLKAAAGTLLSLNGYNSGGAQFIQIHDSSTVPGDSVAGVVEIFTVQFGGADTGAGLAGKYFTAADADGSVYFWFNTGADADPAPVGIARGIEVAVGAGDTTNALATALAAAADADAAFSSAAVTDTATITNSASGARTDVADGDSGLTFATTQQGVTAVVSVPVLILAVAATSNFTLPLSPLGVPFANGISITNSSTSATKTVGSADCFFSAVVK